METVAIIAGIAILLLVAELLLPTGGLAALIGACGLVAAGIVALNEHEDASDYIGPGLIALGVLAAATFFVITPKIIRAQKEPRVLTGWEELIGREAEVREALDPIGQIWIEGALWRAEVPDGADRIGIGNTVRIDSVDGLTLVVSPIGDPPTAPKGT